MDTTSYFQSLARSLTRATICSAVRVGPEANFRDSVWPVARSFTFVPPTSTTSTFMANSLTGLREDCALGRDHRHEFVPGLHERLCSLILELGAQCAEVDSGLCELRQNGF